MQFASLVGLLSGFHPCEPLNLTQSLLHDYRRLGCSRVVWISFMVHFCAFRTLQPLVTAYCLCIEKKICQHILLCISQKEEGHTGFKRHGGEDRIYI